MQGELPPQGTFAGGEFPALLREVVSRLAQGRLDVLTGKERRTIWLEAGQIRALSSEVEDEKLGSWLVERGILEPQRMALALLRQPESVLYGKQLVEEGALEVDQLRRELEARAVALLDRMLFAAGSYWFSSGAKFTSDSLGFERTTASLLADAVRACDDLKQLEKLIDSGRYLWAGEDTLLTNQKVDLTPHEAYLLSRVDGTTTAATLRRVVPLPAAEATRSLAVLVAAGLVEVHRSPATKPMAPVETELPRAVDAKEEDEEALQFTPEEQREFEEIVRLAAESKHRDFYRRLGLTPGATQDQVHARFRELARTYHPDRVQEAHLKPLRRELAEIYSCLQEAHDVLVDPERRAEYDQLFRQTSVTARDRMGSEEQRQRARSSVVDANLKRAKELFRIGDIGMAVQLLDQAARFDPRPDTLLMLARLEFRNPMWVQRALDHLRRAVTVDPRCTEAWLELANFWASRARTDRQRQCLERILEYDPTNQDAMEAMSTLGGRRKSR